MALESCDARSGGNGMLCDSCERMVTERPLLTLRPVPAADFCKHERSCCCKCSNLPAIIHAQRRSAALGDCVSQARDLQAYL